MIVYIVLDAEDNRIMTVLDSKSKIKPFIKQMIEETGLDWKAGSDYIVEDYAVE